MKKTQLEVNITMNCIVNPRKGSNRRIVPFHIVKAEAKISCLVLWNAVFNPLDILLVLSEVNEQNMIILLNVRRQEVTLFSTTAISFWCLPSVDY